MPLNNTTISSTRAGVSKYTARAVQVDFPTQTQRIMAQGAEVPAMLYDVPTADYKRGDIVTITAVSGSTSLPADTVFTVGLVSIPSAPLATLAAELTTFDR